MLDFSSVLGAAQGQAPSREVVAAREGLTLAQRRAASRAVRRGEAAGEPAVARLAVAQARSWCAAARARGWWWPVRGGPGRGEPARMPPVAIAAGVVVVWLP